MTMRRSTVLRQGVAALFATVAVGVVSIGTAPHAGACSCASTTDAEAIEMADVAFAGTLVDVIAPAEGAVISSGDLERFVFDVRQVFKGTGEVTERQSVVTPRGGESCGLEIAGSGEFLVFAFDAPDPTSGASSGEYHSHLCSGTRLLADREVPVQFTGAAPVAPHGSPTAEPDANSVAVADDGDRAPWVLVAGGAGALLLLAAVRWARG